jgi:excisionase family DNA binding protein
VSTKSKKPEVHELVNELEQVLKSTSNLSPKQRIAIRQTLRLLQRHKRMKLNGKEIIAIPTDLTTLRVRGHWRAAQRKYAAKTVAEMFALQEKEEASKFVSTDEVAEHFGVTKQTVRDWIKNGTLKAMQTVERGRYLIPREAFEFMVEQKKKSINATDYMMKELFGDESDEWELDFEDDDPKKK